jgi:anaerobic ribonucleoside-triphosphate reductase
MKDELEIIDEEIEKLKKKMSNPDLAKGTAETWSRVSGYMRPVSAWNTGKRDGEYPSRLNYEVPK